MKADIYRAIESLPEATQEVSYTVMFWDAGKGPNDEGDWKVWHSTRNRNEAFRIAEIISGGRIGTPAGDVFLTPRPAMVTAEVHIRDVVKLAGVGKLARSVMRAVGQSGVKGW